MSTDLGSTGTVYVTLAAAQTYARFEGLQIEEARRELTELLLDARRVGEDASPERWRMRSRSEGLDIGAHVSRECEGRLAVVVREYGPRRRR